MTTTKPKPIPPPPAQKHQVTTEDEKKARIRADIAAAIDVPERDRERFLRTIMLAIAQTPDLLECKSSLPIAAALAARRGWEIGLHCYLYPRKVDGVMTAVLHASVPGLVDLAHRSGVKKIAAVEVHERDEYAMVDGVFTHRADPFATDRGPVVGVWAYAVLPSGERLDELVTIKDLAVIEAQGRKAAGKKSPWDDFPGEMRKKSAIRRLLKRCPTTAEAGTALAELDALEYGNTPSPRHVVDATRALPPAPVIPPVRPVLAAETLNAEVVETEATEEVPF